MDTYFFEQPLKALIKAGFLLLTYIGSIVFKEFSIAVVLPVVMVYFLSNMSDYAELAFVREDKVEKVRQRALVIFIVMLIIVVFTASICITDNVNIKNFVNKIYWIFYFLCAPLWGIPLHDGFKGQKDAIRKKAQEIEQQVQSDSAYELMKQKTLNNKKP